MQPIIPEDAKELPLEQAYQFAEKSGLKNEAEAIRNMVIDHGLSYSNWIRRACIISLFTGKNIYQEFKQTCWPEGDTADGQSKTNVYFEAKNLFDETNNYTTELRAKVKSEERALLGGLLAVLPFIEPGDD